MPRKDGTGPLGKGPLTGLGKGFCAKNVDDNTNVKGRRFGHGHKENVKHQRGFRSRLRFRAIDRNLVGKNDNV